MSSCTPIVNDSHYIQWINTLTGDCIYGWQECISLLLGYLSIFCWLNAQMPQVIKNYRLGEAESLSFSFLTVWLIGDVANFIGCISTHQLPFQLYLSIYFIIIDTILCLQYLYYVKYPSNMLRRWIHQHNDQELKINIEVPNEETRLLPSQKNDEIYQPSSFYHSTTTTKSTTTLMMIGLFTFYSTSTFLNGHNNASLTTMESYEAVTAAADAEMFNSSFSQQQDDMIWIGRFFAWLCTFLYLASRLPQIIKNFRRRSVEGLSMALFFFAACGNLTYVLSIFTNPHATRKTILEAVPYLLGSAGTLCFDGTIFGQYLVWRPHQKQQHLSYSDDILNV
ncbi:PQ loop repeat-domain-containing protein [Absidia repens]|uniref:PQ loop repeat-domain-containing protein n=1 Tax=Absidia repens TaxID=90262 RepID=A0A1X2IGH3_9FUNG|nr:PQ loop repeat-domain-containing protein [Absidia repens]